MKLLTRTVRNYILFSTLLLLVSSPIFYFSIQGLFIHRMDRELLSHKNEFYELIPLLKTQSDFKFFGLMNDEILLKDASYLMKEDSFLTADIYSEEKKAHQPYRILRTGVLVQGKPYVLQIQESMVNTAELISAIVAIQVVLIALLLAGFGFINRKLSKTVWKPFYDILDKLKRYQIDRDDKIDLPDSFIHEFRDLSIAVSQLVTRNHQAFQSRKEFTENAAHELQTPLAICSTKLELLAQTKELTQEQADLVVNLLDATDRITRLNKNLLLLSKIENRQFLETERIELKTIVTKCVDVYSSKALEKGLTVKLSFNETVRVPANPVLLEVLINNVISNAFRYTPVGGTVTIEGKNSQLVVGNSGEPLEHPEKIFQRFHRESRSIPGSGLGLSIVKMICEVAGYELSYRYASSVHQFRISFSCG
ncbi:MAG: HAMP domain-containing sensor histidine kinase [Cyclobacteriaceae bacterium]